MRWMLKNGWLLSSDMVDSLDCFDGRRRAWFSWGCGAARRGLRPRRNCSGRFEKRHQAALAIERGKIVVAADMRLADIHLRHGSTSGARHHFLAPAGFAINQH